MKASLRRLWKFFNTPLGEMMSDETVSSGVEAAEAVLELAGTLEEQAPDLQQLAPILSRCSTLLDVLNSPLMEVVGASLPFINIGTGLLKWYLETTQEEPSLGSAVAIVAQAAYLESLREVFREEEALREKLEKKTRASAGLARQIEKLGEIELEDREARFALVYFHESQLAREFNTVLAARLQEENIEAGEAKRLAEKVARNAEQYLYSAVADAGDGIERVLKWYQAGGKEVFEKYLSIETYLEEQIAPKSKETINAKETFTFEQIYVPLKAIPLDVNGKEIISVRTFVLEEWAREMLESDEKEAREKVMFVQGAPGRGKSVFCRMFADWVRQHLHPIWTPILIRLRDIEHFQQSFEETLRDAVKADFAKTDEGWLTDRNTRFLFLLDGFDELRLEGRESGGIGRFIRQVGIFQRDSQNSEMGHRVILTGRSLALQGISSLPQNLARVKLLSMDGEIQEKWLENWGKVVDNDANTAKEKTEALREFLQSQNCPKTVREELAREPLLLYLLAAMHRDGALKLDDFEGTTRIQAKIQIYEKSLDWVLREQRDSWLQQQLTGIEGQEYVEDLCRILTEAGLCVVQSGGEYAKVRMIEKRLQGETGSIELINRMREKKGDEGLKNALAVFYLQPASGSQEGSVEFFHKSFGEFLCAKRIVESLEEWTKRKRRGFNLSDDNLAWEIYDLFGFGGLTPEIVEYLMGLLIEINDFDYIALFQRLENFYECWCEGEYIDARPDGNYPQKKMLTLKEEFKDRDQILGLRQVDIYTGLNVIILLLELHRYGQTKEARKYNISFYPCGKPNDAGQLENDTKLLNIISYSGCIGAFGFLDTVGKFLRRANLAGVNLAGVNLAGANLAGVNLAGANLIRANLTGANLANASLICTKLTNTKLTGINLIRANLTGSNLDDTSLIRANLTDANLTETSLIGAYLTSAQIVGTEITYASIANADFAGADLTFANFARTNLSDEIWGDIRWDETTNWEGVQGLETAINVPDRLKQQLGLS
ncbi:MAG: pentapeptide repeat-containing protein [Cyanobacteria bacterium P01_E01_bin.42]